jgi:hypothetical protein
MHFNSIQVLAFPDVVHQNPVYQIVHDFIDLAICNEIRQKN